MAGSSDQETGTHTFLYNKYNSSLVKIQARKSLILKINIQMATSKKTAAKRQFKQVECFNVVKHEEKFIITIGNHMATDKKFDTMQQAEQYIATKPYELIANLCYTIFLTSYEIKEKEKEDQK